MNDPASNVQGHPENPGKPPGWIRLALPQLPWKAPQRWGSGSVTPPRNQASLFLLCHPLEWLLYLPKWAGRFFLEKRPVKVFHGVTRLGFALKFTP